MAHIIGLILNNFAETHSKYIMALLKKSPHLEPLSKSLEFEVKAITHKMFTSSLIKNRL